MLRSSKHQSEKYLGDIISKDGKNTKNIKARVANGHGIVNSIEKILDEEILGDDYFEIAVILLISSLLCNSETWFNVTNADIELLEKVDDTLIRKFLKAHSKTPWSRTC